MSFALPAPIIRWLEERGWHGEFERRDISRGMAYAYAPPISKLHCSTEIEGDHVIEADVKGTRRSPYHVELEIYELDGELYCHSECSCPVESQCKHGAAVLEYLSRKPPAAAPAASSSARLPDEVSKWVRLLELEHQAKRKPASTQNFLAYCIEPSSGYSIDSSPVLELRKASEKPRSGLQVTDTRARASVATPAAYFAPEDLPMVAIYQALAKNSYNTPHLIGAEWNTVLDDAMKANRLFYGREGGSYVRLGPGPMRRVKAAWREMPDGNAQPVLTFDDETNGLVFLPVNPPRYVDPVGGLLGPLESDLPPNALQRWKDGPTVAADSLDLLESAFLPLSAIGMPAPKSRPTETLPPTPPAPHLHITESRFGPSYHRFKTILGELRFTYHHSPPLEPLSNKQSPETAWIHDEKRYLCTRNLKQERALEKKLVTFDMVPVHQVFRPHEYQSSDAHRLIFEDPYPDAMTAWLIFLEHHADKLRAEGWTITVDPSSGLVVHEVSGFVPAIEAETDHGIDWFRFDLTGEIDGKRVSLIPYIASAIRQGLPSPDDPDLAENLLFCAENPDDGFFRFPTRRFLEICHQVAHLFQGDPDGPPKLDRLAAADIAHTLEIDGSKTVRELAAFGRKLADIHGLPATKPPAGLKAELRPYQLDGFRWLHFLAEHQLHGILADDMGLGKTVQTLAYLATRRAPRKKDRKPSLVIAPKSVITNWEAEAARFTPKLKTLLLQGTSRGDRFSEIPTADLVLTSYPLLVRDHEILAEQHWDSVILDEAQAIKNPRTAAARHACSLPADHRFCLSGTPMENHLGELWSLMRFLMPGFLGDTDTFRENYRRPIERDASPQAQLALNRRVAPLILRRTKDQVATDLPEKTEIIHHLDLSPRETDLYESIRALMDKRVRDAIAERGLGKSHIIVLDALLKLRQVCCHHSLLKIPEAKNLKDATKLDFLTKDLLPPLIEDGRRILIFSQFTSVLALIRSRLEKDGISFLELTGQTRNRAALVKTFQKGETPVFLISLKAGGTGLNLTAADTVIHYDPWWNPAAENQATDRAHRIGQTKPVFVHKLICRGTIEDRILELQAHKARIVKSLLSDETSSLRMDQETLSALLAPLD
ncbi:SNF2-related protein [Haloferula chungangensis]|uniref:SNF2-related protein n=1 Tax=Haloferula chungangensis TaxID=1048331 RepID=A0ABW2L6B4_9BACT